MEETTPDEWGGRMGRLEGETGGDCGAGMLARDPLPPSFLEALQLIGRNPSATPLLDAYLAAEQLLGTGRSALSAAIASTMPEADLAALALAIDLSGFSRGDWAAPASPEAP